MEMNLLAKDKTSINIEIVGLDETTLHLIVEELLKDDAVVVANYSMGHPQLDKPTPKPEASSPSAPAGTGAGTGGAK